MVCPKPPASPDSFWNNCSCCQAEFALDKKVALPCPVTSSLTRTEAVLGRQLGQSGLSAGFVPSVPSMPHHSPATGKHCLQPHFRQQPLPQWLSKKAYLRFGFVFPRGRVFLMPFPIILISSDFPHWPQIVTRWREASRTVLCWRCSCCRRWGKTTLEGLDSREQRKKHG